MTRKVLFWLVALAAVVPVTVIYGIGFAAAYRVTHAPRQDILKTPADYGLAFEPVNFASTDSIPLKGWWIPGHGDAVIVVAHGYGANKAGWRGTDTDGNDQYLDWLAAAPALHDAGFNLLYFDQRACGESGGDKITFGKEEANDLVGAVRWVLADRNRGDGGRFDSIGLLGFSMGGNVALRGAVELKKLGIAKTAVISIGAYRFDTMIEKSIRFWTSLPGFFIPVVKQMTRLIVGFDPSREIDPSHYVGRISPTPVLFIQAEKDEIGDVGDAHAIFRSAGEPKELILLPNALRFDAYRYPAENPRKIISFYSDHLL